MPLQGSTSNNSISANPREPFSMKEPRERALLKCCPSWRETTNNNRKTKQCDVFEAWRWQAVWHWKPYTKRNPVFWLLSAGCSALSWVQQSSNCLAVGHHNMKARLRKIACVWWRLEWQLEKQSQNYKKGEPFLFGQSGLVHRCKQF